MQRLDRTLSAALCLVIVLGEPFAGADESPTFKETPQEYGLVFRRSGNAGEQARVQARSGGKVFAAAEDEYVIERERAYKQTGAFPPIDAATTEAMVKKKQAVLLSNGTKIQFVRSSLNTADGVFTTYAQVRVLSGPAKDKVVWVSRQECFPFEPFPLKPTDEAMLSKGRLLAGATGVAVVGEIPAYNMLLRSWRDGEPDKNNAAAKQASSVHFQEVGTRVRIQVVACSPDRTDHYGLAGAAVSVEILDGEDRGKVGWTLPEAIVRTTAAEATEDTPPPARPDAPAQPKAGPAAGWLALKTTRGGFTVDLAGEPNIKESETVDGAAVTSLGFRARGLEQRVVATHSPTEIAKANETKTLQRIRDRAVSKIGSRVKIHWERADTLGPLHGLEFSLTFDQPSVGEVQGSGWAFANGKTAYLLLVITAAKSSTIPPEVSRFLDSFTIIGPNQTAGPLADSDRRPAKPAAKPGAKSGRTRWGTEVAPDGDVKIRSSAQSLTMQIPGTPHILAAERDKRNAPRVVTPVAGDFVVTVRVAGAFSPSPRSTFKGFSSRQAGGLILWKDPQNYLALQRPAMASDDGEDKHQAVLEEVVAGSKGVTSRLSASEGSILVRLARKRGRIEADFSSDGKVWKEFKPVNTTWAEGELQVGVVAVTTSTGPHEVTFEDYSLTTK